MNTIQHLSRCGQAYPRVQSTQQHSISSPGGGLVVHAVTDSHLLVGGSWAWGPCLFSWYIYFTGGHALPYLFESHTTVKRNDGQLEIFATWLTLEILYDLKMDN